MKIAISLFVILSIALPTALEGLSSPLDYKSHNPPEQVSARRSFLASCLAVGLAIVQSPDPSHAAVDLKFTTTPSGLQWADAKVGTGSPLQLGKPATVDYVLSTTGARYGTKIFATSDKDLPYRWILGDGSTIAGMEQAIVGAEGIPPMLPGGIRRVVIPQALGYNQLAINGRELCVQDGRPCPIPPPNQAFEEYQRFKNIYCNPERQYQPDIVMDIKLYGARSQR